MHAIGTFRRPWTEPGLPRIGERRAFSQDEWERARRRLKVLTGDEDLLRAFDRVRAGGKIDACFMQRLDRYGVLLSDLFAVPSGRGGNRDDGS